MRDVEARYLGKLGFDLIARHGRIGEDQVHFEAGVSWTELDAIGLQATGSRSSSSARSTSSSSRASGRCRASTTSGVALDEDEFERRARARDEAPSCACRSTAAGERSSSTNAGYRLELHPPRDWIDDLLEDGDRLRLSELHLKADDPERRRRRSREVLDCERLGADVEIGETLVRFVPGGPQGRPELHAELFDRADF